MPIFVTQHERIMHAGTEESIAEQCVESSHSLHQIGDEEMAPLLLRLPVGNLDRLIPVQRFNRRFGNHLRAQTIQQ